MRLPRAGREYYQIQITTEPAVASWEASFDGGATWVTGDVPTVGEPVWRWLVAGPDFDPLTPGFPDAAYTTVTAEMQLYGGDWWCGFWISPRRRCQETEQHRHPIIRGVDTPEVIVRDGPKIVLVAHQAT